MTWNMFYRVLLAGFFSGIMFWGMKLAGRAMKAEAMLTVMFIVAITAYIPFMWYRGTIPVFKGAPPVALWGLGIACIACVLTNILGFTQYIKPGVPQAQPFIIAMGMNVAVQVLGSIVLFHEPIRIKQAVGIVLMLGAMALLKP